MNDDDDDHADFLGLMTCFIRQQQQLSGYCAYMANPLSLRVEMSVCVCYTLHDDDRHEDDDDDDEDEEKGLKCRRQLNSIAVEFPERERE